MPSPQRSNKLGLLVRVGLFVFLALVGVSLFPVLMRPLGGYLIAGVLGIFAAAAVANALVLRVYERGRLADIGLGWSNASRRNLAVGFAGGAGAALLVVGVPLLTPFASLHRDPEFPGGWETALFVGIVLLFGAIGEELLFRGYAFQVLLRELGPFATILPVSVLFGLSHSANAGSSPLSLANTIGWGIVLGVAFLRSGDLWLPIGLHYGWNLILPLLGVPLSGFRMGITGYVLDWHIGDLWSGGSYGPEGGILTSFVLLPLALYLWKAPIDGQEAFLLRRRKEG